MHWRVLTKNREGNAKRIKKNKERTSKDKERINKR